MHDLAALKSERCVLAAKLAEVVASRQRLQQASSDEARVIAMIGDLGKDEVDALREWARTGEGAKPQPNEARRELNDALVAAQAATETARACGADLDAEQTAIVAELAQIHRRIEDAALVDLEATRQTEHRDFDQFVRTHVKPRLARMLAYHPFLIGLAREHQSAGRTDAARELFQRAEALAGAMPASLDVTQGDVLGTVSAWSRRMADLTADAAAADNVVKIETAA